MIKIAIRGKFSRAELDHLRALAGTLNQLPSCPAARITIARYSCDRRRCMAWLPWSRVPVVGSSVARLCERVTDSARMVAGECSRLHWRRIVATHQTGGLA